MQKGDVVKFKDPTPEEEHERFLVLEMRTPRVLVGVIGSNMAIPPTHTYLKEELCVC